jgi:uncharacterized repeat protein (TIGR03847 family)
VFYIQARSAKETITLLTEKEQVQMLAHGIVQLLGEVDEKYSSKLQSRPVDRMDLELQQPLEPVFRVGQLELGYDLDSDLVLLMAHEQVLIEEEEGEEEDLITEAEKEAAAEAAAAAALENASLARLWATRAQMRAMADHALEVVARGRPVCALCGRPEEAGGHICPKRNGHLRTQDSI